MSVRTRQRCNPCQVQRALVLGALWLTACQRYLPVVDSDAGKPESKASNAIKEDAAHASSGATAAAGGTPAQGSAAAGMNSAKGTNSDSSKAAGAGAVKGTANMSPAATGGNAASVQSPSAGASASGAGTSAAAGNGGTATNTVPNTGASGSMATSSAGNASTTAGASAQSGGGGPAAGSGGANASATINAGTGGLGPIEIPFGKPGVGWYCIKAGEACSCVQNDSLVGDSCDTPHPPCCFRLPVPMDAVATCICYPEASMECATALDRVAGSTKITKCPP